MLTDQPGSTPGNPRGASQTHRQQTERGRLNRRTTKGYGGLAGGWGRLLLKGRIDGVWADTPLRRYSRPEQVVRPEAATTRLPLATGWNLRPPPGPPRPRRVPGSVARPGRGCDHRWLTADAVSARAKDQRVPIGRSTCGARTVAELRVMPEAEDLLARLGRVVEATRTVVGWTAPASPP